MKISRMELFFYRGNCFHTSRRESLQDILLNAYRTPDSFYHYRITVADRPTPFMFMYGIE